MSIRTAGIIIIGDEILNGNVKDENIRFLCLRFQDLGVRVEKIAIVGDIVDDIAEEVNDFSTNYDLVIACGGVGPTHDDVTYQGVALAFQLEIVLNEQLYDYWKNDPMENELSAKKMSTVPQNSKIIFADVSEKEKGYVVAVSNVYLFPGSPDLLRSRFIALERQHFVGFGTKFHKREIFLSVDETDVLSVLNETARLYSDVAIGSYPEIDNRHYFTRLTLHSHEERRVIEAHDRLVCGIDPMWILDPSTFNLIDNEIVYF